MANIRVDLIYTPISGETITFKAPCDASAITGMIVYYPDTAGSTVSKEFTLTDANGNNIGVLDNIFAKDAIVKAVLDMNKSKAYIQNPDTNAYLEAQLASKAPAGYGGFGEFQATNNPTTADEFYTLLDSKLDSMPNYSSMRFCVDIPESLTVEWCEYFVATLYKQGANKSNAVCRFQEYGSGREIVLRRSSSGWGAVEWVNPRMAPGVEYRTTERINGKAVYKRNNGGIIEYRLDDETTWKPYADAVGASESQKYMFMVSSKGARTINTQGWYRVCSIDLSPDGYYDGTSFIMSISHVHSGSTAETLQVLVSCNERNPNIIVLGGGSDVTLCYSKVRLTFDKTNTKFNFDIYWDANYQNQAQAPNFIVFLNGRHTHKSHEEIFTAVPLTLIDTLPSTESVIKEHIVKPIGSGNILTDASGVKKSGDTMTGALKISTDNIGNGNFHGGQYGAYLEAFKDDYNRRRQLFLYNPDTNSDLEALGIWNSATGSKVNILHTGNSNMTRLVSTETTPTVNNEINWTYE